MAKQVSSILYVYPPQDATARHRLYPYSLELHSPWNMPTELTGTWTSIPPEKWPEDGSPPAAFPIQQGAYFEWKLGANYLSRGKWDQITRVQADGAAMVTLGGLDKLAVLQRTVASITLTNIASAEKDFYAFNKYTGAVDAGGGTLTSPTAVRLYPGQYRSGDSFPHVWYPKYDSAAWLPATGTSRDLTDLGFSDTLAGNITDAATTIKLSQNYKGAPETGWISITTGGNEEWIPYDGYDYNEADGYFYFYNCVRLGAGGGAGAGWLGSYGAIAHSAGDTVYFRIPRRMHFTHPVIVEGVDGTTYTSPIEVISDGNFKLNPEDFSVNFTREPLSLGARGAEGGGGYAGRTAYGSMWFTGAYMDEDNVGGSALYLGAFLKTLYEQGMGKLGPAFGGTDTETCTVVNSLSPDIPITNVRVIQPGMTNWEVTQALLNDLGLNKGQGKDAVHIYYDPDADQIIIEQVAQSATPTYYYTGERSITQSLPEQPKSAYMIRSAGNDQANKLTETRMWHPAIDPTLAGEPLGCHRFGDDGSYGYKHSTITNYDGGGGGIYLTLAYPLAYNILAIKGQENYPNLITDNTDKTGFGLAYKTNPSARNMLWAWGPDCAGFTTDKKPDLLRASRVLIAFDMSATTSEDATTPLLDVQVLGYRDCTPDQTSTYETEPTGTAIGMGTGSRLIMPAGSYERLEPVVWEFECDEIVNSISLYVRSLPKTTATSGYFSGTWPFMFRVIEVALFGEPYAVDIVQARTTFSSATTGGYLTAPNTAAKILDGKMGQHNAGIMDIGPATAPARKGLGKLQLALNWRVSQPQSYVNNSTGMDVSGIPTSGRTARHSDGFEGVVEDFTYKEAGGLRELSITSRNYLNNLYGVAN